MRTLGAKEVVCRCSMSDSGQCQQRPSVYRARTGFSECQLEAWQEDPETQGLTSKPLGLSCQLQA